ncbi:MAG: hypothetical protein M3291_03140 [Actinomycetota bacterium]|nr:hypothetical protein [Actinomycetota bacterium]
MPQRRQEAGEDIACWQSLGWRHTLSYVAERIEWDSNAAGHIRTRSTRYADAVDLDPDWTIEVVNDPDRLVDEPDPRSAHANSVRIVGYSSTARMVITVVALRDARGVLRGTSAGKTRGAPLRQYLEDRPDD